MLVCGLWVAQFGGLELSLEIKKGITAYAGECPSKGSHIIEDIGDGRASGDLTEPGQDGAVLKSQ